MLDGTRYVSQPQSFVKEKKDQSTDHKLRLISFEDVAEKECPDIVTQSSRMRDLIRVAKRVARSSASIMLTGESGTGKELFARLIHCSSSRGDQPFVRVNCAALPTTLIESELFGHERGSFTDAVEKRTGRFELAEGGSLLLDEVSEIPIATQAKLLRVLEEQEFERIGSNQTIKTNVRVIATSNRDLRREIEKGTFRLDLFHRLSVVELEILPLRQRTIDIPLLATHFVSRFQSENPEPVRGFTKLAMQSLAQHAWPGNVRELRNVVHRACILSDGPLIDHLTLGVLGEQAAREPVLGELPEWWLQTKLADIEKQIILAAIEKYGNRRIVAEKLGVTSRTLSNKLRRYRSENHGGFGDEPQKAA